MKMDSPAHSAQSLQQSSPQAVPSGGADGRRPRVVIVGAGFGGLTVATAGLSPADIAWPIRGLVRHQRNTRVLLGAVTGVDRVRKHVVMGGRNIAYYALVLATGATHGCFGHDSWAAHAPGLKRIDDATEIRRRLLLAFERAEMESDARERERLLTIVIVGGGPTGVELAGAVVELAHSALADDFRAIDPQQTRVLLVEAGPRLLPSFPESLSRGAERALRRLGVDILPAQEVTRCAATGVTLGDENVAADTVIWAAGVAASKAADWLAAAGDRVGRVLVGADLRLKGWLACWIWGIAHVYFLISLRNRLIVMMQWLWSYASFERGARLITGLHPLKADYEPDREPACAATACRTLSHS